jgi:peptidyl-prolyl cis-trans isomerase D
MMSYLRQNIKMVVGVILVVVAAFIGTIFLVWGVGGPSGSSGGEDAAAWVGKTAVSRRQLERHYANMLQFYQQVYKGMSAAELDRRFKLRKTALDNLINREVVVQEARRRQLAVSDEEVRRKIMETSAFQVDGAFNRGRYLEALNGANQTPEQFEDGVREDLIVKKLESLVKEGVKVTDAETMEEYRRKEEKVSLDFVLVSYGPYVSKVSATAEEVASHFEQNREKYRQPERIKVEYLRIEPTKLAADAQVDDAAAAAYYDGHQADFLLPKQVKARHILFRLEEGATPEQEAKVREQAAAVLEQARKGSDFAGLAREFSQDPGSGPNGGDLGYFPRERMVKEFADAAFSLPLGGISDLVKTQFGLHIVKVEAIQEERTETLEEARNKVASKVRAEIGRELARKLADRVAEVVYDQPLDKVAAANGLEARTTEFFGLEEPVPGLPFPKDVKEALFRMKKDEIGDEMQWNNVIYFVRLVDRKAAHEPELADVRARVEGDVKTRKAKEMARIEALSVAAALRGGAAPGKYKEAGLYTSGTTAPFARAGQAAELGADGDLFATAFAQPVGGSADPVEVPRGWVAWKVAGKVAVEIAAFEKEKESLHDTLWNERSERFFDAWVEELKKKAEVKIEPLEASRI